MDNANKDRNDDKEVKGGEKWENGRNHHKKLMEERREHVKGEHHKKHVKHHKDKKYCDEDKDGKDHHKYDRDHKRPPMMRAEEKK